LGVFVLVGSTRLGSRDTPVSRVRTASGSSQGDVPMQAVLAIVNFRGRQR